MSAIQARRECNFVTSKFEISPKFVCSWAYSAQTVHPPPKLTKGTSLGCRLGLETIPITQNCAVWASLFTNTTSKVRVLAVFDICKIPCAEIRYFFTMCLLFQKRSKSVQDKWPKGRVVLVTKTKHVFASLGATPGAISFDFLYECAPWPLTYIPGFIQIRSDLGK